MRTLISALFQSHSIFVRLNVASLITGSQLHTQTHIFCWLEKQKTRFDSDFCISHAMKLPNRNYSLASRQKCVEIDFVHRIHFECAFVLFFFCLITAIVSIKLSHTASIQHSHCTEKTIFFLFNKPKQRVLVTDTVALFVRLLVFSLFQFMTSSKNSLNREHHIFDSRFCHYCPWNNVTVWHFFWDFNLKLFLVINFNFRNSRARARSRCSDVCMWKQHIS